MDKEIRRNQPSSRFFAFGAIVFSTVSVTGCLLVFPLIFHYLQTLEASVQVDLNFCNVRSRDMWNAIVDIHGAKGNSGRMARAAAMKQDLKHHHKTGHSKKSNHKANFWAKDAKAVDKSASNDTKNSSKDTYASNKTTTAKPNSGTIIAIDPFIQCCTCHRGPPGPIGPNGRDGQPGDLGPRGKAGERGDPSPSDKYVLDKSLKQCPCEIVPGNPGEKGPKGVDGPFGDPGAPGVDGKDGGQGIRGPGGFPGRDGRDGPKGPKGDPGKQISKRGDPGERGAPGKDGEAGPQGPPGVEGKDGGRGAVGPAGWPGVQGIQGRRGRPGPNGDIGKDGGNGTCTHCNPPRLGPGY